MIPTQVGKPKSIALRQPGATRPVLNRGALTVFYTHTISDINYTNALV